MTEIGRNESRKKRILQMAYMPVLGALFACGAETGGDESEVNEAEESVAAQPAGLPNPYEQVQHWGELPDGREWGNVSGVDIGPGREQVWVAERCGANSCVGSEVDAVLRFNPDGSLVNSFASGLFVRPHGMDVDPEGNVWVADDQGASGEELENHPDAAEIGHRAVKFSPEGQILMTLGTAGKAGDPPTHLTRPSDVLVAPDGDVFVAEGHSSEEPPARISKFDSEGNFLMSWGEFGSGPGQFRTAHALAMDSEGRIFVADRGNNRIQIFDQDGNFLEEWDQFGRPNDVFIDSEDRIYVVDAQSDEETNPGMRRGIYIGDAGNGEVTEFIPANEDYNPGGSEGLAVDADRNIYVGEISVPGMTGYLRQ